MSMDGSDGRELVGQTLMNKLEVLRLIGAGGMGAVYEVRHLLTKHHRALKLLHPQFAKSPEVVARFVREAGVAGTLRSEHVVETFDAGQLEDGSAYVLMELLEGRSLAGLLEERGRLEAAHAARLVWQACEGVAVAHAAGIVHRDLKPDNLFVVRREDGRETVKLLDFGISKFTTGYEHAGTLTSEGSMMGTPYYMSPEQAKGAKDVDERADIYALGVILYEALTGLRPFDEDSFPALVIKIHTGEYRPVLDLRPELDPAMADVVHRAMHVDPAERFASARELQDALRQFVDEELPARASRASTRQSLDDTVAASAAPGAARAAPTPAPTSVPPGPAPRRAPLVAGVALGLVGAVAGVAALSMSGPSDDAVQAAPEPTESAPEPDRPIAAAPAPVPAAVEPGTAVERARDAGAPAAEAPAPPPDSPRPAKVRPGARPRPQPAGASRAAKAGLDTDNPYGE